MPLQSIHALLVQEYYIKPGVGIEMNIDRGWHQIRLWAYCMICAALYEPRFFTYLEGRYANKN